jgi:hypothetical protein
MANKYCNCEQFYDSEAFKSGAKVTFRELPVIETKRLSTILDDEFTIKAVLFKVNGLGDIIMAIELNELPGKYFSPNLFRAVEVTATPAEKVTDNTLDNLISTNKELSIENSYLKSIVEHSFLGNFNN